MTTVLTKEQFLEQATESFNKISEWDKESGYYNYSLENDCKETNVEEWAQEFRSVLSIFREVK